MLFIISMKIIKYVLYQIIQKINDFLKFESFFKTYFIHSFIFFYIIFYFLIRNQIQISSFWTLINIIMILWFFLIILIWKIVWKYIYNILFEISNSIKKIKSLKTLVYWTWLLFIFDNIYFFILHFILWNNDVFLNFLLVFSLFNPMYSLILWISIIHLLFDFFEFKKDREILKITFFALLFFSLILQLFFIYIITEYFL